MMWDGLPPKLCRMPPFLIGVRYVIPKKISTIPYHHNMPLIWQENHSQFTKSMEWSFGGKQFPPAWLQVVPLLQAFFVSLCRGTKAVPCSVFNWWASAVAASSYLLPHSEVLHWRAEWILINRAAGGMTIAASEHAGRESNPLSVITPWLVRQPWGDKPIRCKPPNLDWETV